VYIHTYIPTYIHTHTHTYPAADFEPAIPARERPQTNALDLVYLFEKCRMSNFADENFGQIYYLP
jgi:hypothetical protein